MVSLIVRLSRICAWISMGLMVVYVITGFSMMGLYGINHFIKVGTARWIHDNLYLAWFLVFTVFLHSIICINTALRRWRIIK